MVDLKVCKRCSAPITPGHAFCPRCGAALDVTEPATGPSEAADAAEPASEAADAAEPASEAESAPPTPASEAADAAEPASEAESAPPTPASEAADAAEPASEAESAPPTPASEAADAAEPQDPQLGAFGVAPSETNSPAARLAAAAASRTSSQVHVPVGWPVDVDEMQRSAARDASTRAAAAARDASTRAAAAAREAAARAAAEKVAAVNAALDMEAEMDPEDCADSAPEPVAQDGARTSDRILTPSATNRTLGSIGAGRPASALAAPTLTRAAAPAQGPTPGPRT